MDTSEIEAWTLEVVRRLKADEQLEDRRVELKREWPTPQAGSYAKAARQLAGLANANHPEHGDQLPPDDGQDHRARPRQGQLIVSLAALPAPAWPATV